MPFVCPPNPGRQFDYAARRYRMLTEIIAEYWVPCAVTAIIFMMVVGFMAWWYQRRMRDMFTERELTL